MALDETEAQRLIQEDFAAWRRERQRAFEREERLWHKKGEDRFISAWARVAHLAEYRRDAMGRDLAKAQARIGRQRRANRRLVEELREAKAEIERLSAAESREVEG